MKHLIILLAFLLIGGGVIAQSNEASTDSIYTFVQQAPSFPGGFDAMLTFFKKHTYYPKAEEKAKMEGVVYVRFNVSKTGKLSGIKVLREVKDAPGLTKEALRLVNLMPVWEPGKDNGVPVTVRYDCPIKFALDNR